MSKFCVETRKVKKYIFQQGFHRVWIKFLKYSVLSQINYRAPDKTSHRLSLPQAASCSCSCGLGDHFNIVEGDEDVFENSAGNKFNRSFFFCDLCFLNSLRFEICTAKLIFWSFVLDSSTKLTTFNLNDIFVKLTLYVGPSWKYKPKFLLPIEFSKIFEKIQNIQF